MDISVKVLEAFKVVAECENLTKASKRLYLSQSQLSRTIAQLENHIGLALFDRNCGRLVLNSCGKEFYKYAVQILNLIDKAQSAVQDVYLYESSQITLTANATAHMPSLLKFIKRSMPELKLRQIAATEEQLKDQLIEGKADFAICFPPPDEPEFESTILFYEYPAIIYPDDHWLKDRTTVSIDELREENLICLVKGFASRDAGNLFFGIQGMRPKIAVETAEQAQVVEYVKEGLGIGVIPKCLIIRDSFLKEHSVELENSPSMSLSLVWKKGRSFSEIDRMFLNSVKEYFALKEDC